MCLTKLGKFSFSGTKTLRGIHYSLFVVTISNYGQSNTTKNKKIWPITAAWLGVFTVDPFSLSALPLIICIIVFLYKGRKKKSYIHPLLYFSSIPYHRVGSNLFDSGWQKPKIPLLWLSYHPVFWLTCGRYAFESLESRRRDVRSSTKSPLTKCWCKPFYRFLTSIIYRKKTNCKNNVVYQTANKKYTFDILLKPWMNQLMNYIFWRNKLTTVNIMNLIHI